VIRKTLADKVDHSAGVLVDERDVDELEEPTV
jgi:hypothetical protein